MTAKPPKIAALIKGSLLSIMHKRLDTLQKANLHTLYGFDPYKPDTFKILSSKQGLGTLKEPITINPNVLECLTWMLNIIALDIKKIVMNESEDILISLRQVSPVMDWMVHVNEAHHAYIKSSQTIFNTLVPNGKYADYIKHYGRADTINPIVLEQSANLIRAQFEIFLYLIANKFGFIAQFNNSDNLKHIACTIKAKNLLAVICDMNELAGGNLNWLQGIVELFKGNIKSTNMEIMQHMVQSLKLK